VLVKGAEYSRDQVVGAAEVEAGGGRIELIDMLAGHSTSAIIARLASPGS
jgi:D-beta-D-heptose 7-phosphate kinase/D-beta-D-heptose 1-phosphate adenosyltransferase